MKIESIEEVLTLRNERAAALKLRDGVWNGLLGNFDVWIEGERHQVLSTVSEKYLRAAISYNAEALVDSIDQRLRELGVSTPRLERSKPPTVEAAMSELKMYQNAWLRSLGGSIRNKRHLIDALVVTTEEMRDLAQKHTLRPSVPKAVHDARVTELLEFNNKLEQRARDAERKLKAFMDGTSAERLAFAVEHAAATVISDIRTSKFL